MNWTEALQKMKEGHCVRRTSQCVRNLIRPGDGLSMETAPIYEDGAEGIKLVEAQSVDGLRTQVFVGRWSGVMAWPDIEHFDADDWIVEP